MNRIVPAFVGALALAIGIALFFFAATGDGERIATSSSGDPRVGYGYGSLNATLWVQNSAEYRGAALQAYTLAELMLERALGDRAWTASLEQLAAGGYEDLAPAVILDVDETVLDNSPNQARQILDDVDFNLEDWQAWVRESAASPVAGALEFTRRAAAGGVTIFYVTNRRHEVEDATRRNLEDLGFPFQEGRDTLLTRDEMPDWGSEKDTRRLHVGEEFRILLLVGDNLGDFVAGADAPPGARADLVRAHSAFWGTRWIVLPNPQYGSWDGALIEYDYTQSRRDRSDRKLDALDPRR